ncbi:MAG: DUF2933 domain-containing protein [Acidimicrobiales bacterium]
MGEFLAANWVWILIMAVFLAMHLGGHGCGGHGRHHGGHRDDHDRQSVGRDAEGS